MIEDKASKFETKILEIKKILREIKKLNVDTKEIETIIESIERKAEEERKVIYQKYDELDTEAFF